ncbi:MAG TPA: sialidase family protein, partial [Chthonomonadaceae bacterium]|nr:sialidase family protein [Chthonomonadaceae bacterium]
MPKSARAKKAIEKPHWVPNLPESWRIVKKPNGQLAAISTGTVGGKQGVIARLSDDNGLTWSATRLLLPMEGDFGGPDPLVDRNGELQLFFLKAREKKTDDDGSGMPLGIDIWHTRTTGGWKHIRPPVRLWRGYCGSMNCEFQMKNGRILFPFSFYSNVTWGHRGEGTEAFTYRGRGVCTLLYSDDDGATWKLSPARLRVSTPDLSTDEGAIEPVLTQLSDGRVWMLLRTQNGRFYESFSKDGANWSAPRPTRILSSDSPAGLVRLKDGRIVLLWNNTLRFPYAYGGRHVLHGAISSDDGKTWRGFREIAHNPKRDEPPPPRGDHGATYPIPIEVNDGLVITTTGLPSPHYNLRLDPDWLLETEQQTDFSQGMEDWSAFGVRGVGLVAHPDEAGRKALAIRKPEADWPAGAVWNFPAGVSGT